MPTSSSDPTTIEAAGSSLDIQFPGYTLLAELNRGGQGIVYQAIQSGTNRKVAIKISLDRAGPDDATTRRFEREVELVGRLAHPNIISVFHAGRTRDGRDFFVMDYVRGSSLTRYVRERRLTLTEALELFARVCDGVQFAHQRGIIHRDLKPSNILVQETPAEHAREADGDERILGQPRILDFGLAKWMAGPAGPPISRSHVLVGTLPYMAPEQVRGNPDEIDTRTDIYALGLILYELLTGSPPYPVRGHTDDVMRNITSMEPTPPSRAWKPDAGVAASRGGRTASGRPTRTASLLRRFSFRRVRPLRSPIDDEVQTIVLKALAKERERRYQSTAELGNDIRHYLAGEPIDAKRDSGLYVLGKLFRRHQTAFGVILLLMMMALGSSVSIWRLYGRAVTEGDAARAAEGRAVQAVREQQRLLAESHVQSARLAVQRGSWEPALANFDLALAAGHLDGIPVQLGRIEALLALNQSELAAEQLGALEGRSDLGRFKGLVLLWQADVAGMQSMGWEDAEELIREALRAGLDAANESYARGMIAKSTPEAIACFRDAIQHDPFHHRAHHMLATSLLLLGRFDEARDEISLAQSLYPDDLNLKLVLVLVHAFLQDQDAVERSFVQIESQLNARLSASLRRVLNFLAQIGRIQESGIRDDNLQSMLRDAMDAARELFAYYEEISQSENEASDPRNVLLIGLRFPPYLAKSLGRVAKAALMMAGGNDPGALSELEIAVKAHPEGLVFLFYAVLLRDAGRYEEAQNAFLHSAESPSFFDFRHLALLSAARLQWLLANRNPAQADAVWQERCLDSIRKLASENCRLSPNDTRALAIAATRLEDDHLARRIASSWLEREPGNVEAMRCRLRVEYGAGAYGPAVRMADEFLAWVPEDYEILWYRSEAACRLGTLERPNATDYPN